MLVELTIHGFVLIGGASRRMGRDKASMMLSGQTFAQRAVTTLRESCSDVFTVGGENSPSDVAHLLDIEPPFRVEGQAAMVGIYTVLRACTADLAAVLACDMPNVTAEVFGRMVLEFERNETADAVFPLDRSGNPQSLCAIFRPEACLAVIERLPKDRTPAVKDMLRELNVAEVEFSEFSHLPDAESLFANLNTPDDFRAHSK